MKTNSQEERLSFGGQIAILFTSPSLVHMGPNSSMAFSLKRSICKRGLWPVYTFRYLYSIQRVPDMALNTINAPGASWRSWSHWVCSVPVISMTLLEARACWNWLTSVVDNNRMHSKGGYLRLKHWEVYLQRKLWFNCYWRVYQWLTVEE